jgi:outer membrane lipoprotein SlyB
MLSQVNRVLCCAFIASSFAVLAGCANQGVSRQDVNQTINIQYGTIENVEQVKLQSNAAGGAVTGSILGAVIADNSLEGAIIGAFAGGAVTAAAEGKNTANSYTVKLLNNTEVKVVTGAGNLRVGDCVAVEQGKTANIRDASPVHCEHAGHPGVTDPDVTANAQSEASACHNARQLALEAKTDEELDFATKKIRALCES